jgi:hypothetical protein
MAEPSDAERLVRAKSYPYDVPSTSYILFQGEPVPLKRMNPPDDTAERIPVLAYGSNASPQQLINKYPYLSDEEGIPVLKTALTGFDVVYSAHFSSYGAIPAMLVSSPGTRLTTFVTWLTEEQLEVMHDTELGPDRDGTAYTFGNLTGVLAMIDAVGIREEVFMYQSAAPALGHEGAMCAYAEVVARERTVQEYGHERVLQAAQEGIAPDMTLEAFLLETATDPDARAAYTARLHKNGVKAKLKGYKQLMPTLQ